LREKHRNTLAKSNYRSAGNAYLLLEYLYQRPIITVNGVVKVTSLNYSNANKLIVKFQENGILRQMDAYQRNRRFVYSSYLSLFVDMHELEKNDRFSLEAHEEETKY
jgi:Fic family protein